MISRLILGFLLCGSGFISLVFAADEITVAIADETGLPLNSDTPLLPGQTIMFRLRLGRPYAIDTVILQSWNKGIPNYEGTTNATDGDGFFDIRFVIPEYASNNPLPLDLLVKSSAGGQTHYLFGTPSDWQVKAKSFLESVVELREQIFVKKLIVDKNAPKIFDLNSNLGKEGVFFEFKVEDEMLNTSQVKVAGLAADCEVIKKNRYLCTKLVNWSDMKEHRNEIDISAYDMAKNYVIRSLKNTFDSKDTIALAENPKINTCDKGRFVVSVKVKDAVGLKEIGFRAVDSKINIPKPKKSRGRGLKFVDREIKSDNTATLTLGDPTGALPLDFGVEIILWGNNDSQATFFLPWSEIRSPKARRRDKFDMNCFEKEVKVLTPEKSAPSK